MNTTLPSSQSDRVNLAIKEVLAELNRATAKFPTWPTDPLHALGVVGEEFGELHKDVLQLTYEPHKTNAQNVKTEALQTAAMALRFYMSLDLYEYTPGVQHSQADSPPAAPAKVKCDAWSCNKGSVVGAYDFEHACGKCNGTGLIDQPAIGQQGGAA